MELGSGFRIVAGGPWGQTRQHRENQHLRRTVAFFIVHYETFGKGPPSKPPDGPYESLTDRYRAFGLKDGVDQLLSRDGEPTFERQVRRAPADQNPLRTKTHLY